MVRMKTIIELQKLKTLEVVETNAADGLMSSILAGKSFTTQEPRTSARAYFLTGVDVV